MRHALQSISTHSQLDSFFAPFIFSHSLLHLRSLHALVFHFSNSRCRCRSRCLSKINLIPELLLRYVLFCTQSLAKAYFSYSTPHSLSCLHCIWLQKVPTVVQLVAPLAASGSALITPPRKRISCHLLNIHKSFCVITHYTLPLRLARVLLPQTSGEGFICFPRYRLHLLYSCSFKAFALSPDPGEYCITCQVFLDFDHARSIKQGFFNIHTINIFKKNLYFFCLIPGIKPIFGLICWFSNIPADLQLSSSTSMCNLLTQR